MSEEIALTIVQTRNRSRDDVVVWVMRYDRAQAFRDHDGAISGAIPINIAYADDDIADWLIYDAIPFKTKFMVRERYITAPVDHGKLRTQFKIAAVRTRSKA